MQLKTPYRKIAAHYALVDDFCLIYHPVITIDSQGTVVEIISYENGQIDRAEGVEFYNGLLVPGFVNAHCHLELSHLHLAVPEGKGLGDFVDHIASQRGKFTQAQMLDSAYNQDFLLSNSGVAVVGDISNSDLTFDLKSRSKIHYHTFIEVYGSDPSIAARRIAAGQELLNKADRMGISASISPHAVYSMSEEIFDYVACGDGRCSIHFMESEIEKQLFENKGFFAERYAGLNLLEQFSAYVSPADRLMKKIGNNRPLMLVHNTFLDRETLDELDDFYNDLSFTVCPRSNLYIENKLPPFRLLHEKGVNVAIGTDSLSSNKSLEMIEEMKVISAAMTQIDLATIVRWATYGGAKALGISEWAGNITVGKRCGLTLISALDWDKMKLTDKSKSVKII